jgi:hypothetical protein
MIKLTPVAKAALRINFTLIIALTLLDLVKVGSLYAAFLVGLVNYFYVVYEINRVKETTEKS